MKKTFYLFLLATIPLFSHAQRGYIAIDSTLLSGIKLINGGEINNARFIKMKEGKEIIEYNPQQVSRYGFKEGSEYIARGITIQGNKKRVFLEQLVKGDLSLYHYREKGLETFFLEKDSTLFVELPKGKRKL